jgi:hypothetical protein
MQLEVGGVELPGERLAQSDFHADARFAELRESAARHFLKRVLHRDDHAPDPGADDRVGAGRRLPGMTARLERDEHRCAPGTLAGGVERVHLGVRPAEKLMMPLADDRLARDDDGAHGRVGLHASETPLGQCQRTRHHPFVKIRHDHFSS